MSRATRQRVEELARLLDGAASPEEGGAEVRRLATLAATVHEHTPLPTLDPAARAAMRARLLEDLAVVEVTPLARLRDAVRERTARLRHSAKLAVASATASTLIGSAGVAVAAQSALPGDVLYPVKQGTERVRLAFASGAEETGRLKLTLARERLEEIVTGVEQRRLSPELIIATLAEMDRLSEQGAEDLLSVLSDNPEVAELLSDFTREQREQLLAIRDRLPLAAQPFADRSLQLLRRIEIVLAALVHCEGCLDADGVPVRSVEELLGSDTTGTDAGESGFLTRLVERLIAGDDPASGLTGDTTGPLHDEGGDGVGLPLDTSAGDLTGEVGGTLGGTIEGTTDAVGDAVGGTLGDTVEGTGGAVGGVVEDTSGTLGDTVDSTTDTVDGTLDSTTDTLRDGVNDVGGSAGGLINGDGGSSGGTIGGLLP